MRISAYIISNTSGDRVRFFPHVTDEIVEAWEELIRGRWMALREECSDVVHFLQLWAYWRFGVDGELWRWSMPSVYKFMARIPVWRRIYIAAGLDPQISNFCGNYAKAEKVVKQLARYGVPRETAERAFREVVGSGSTNEKSAS